MTKQITTGNLFTIFKNQEHSQKDLKNQEWFFKSKILTKIYL